MLAEVLVAAGILATALTSVAQLFAIAVSTNIAAQDLTIATMLAAQKVEEMAAMPATTLSALPPFGVEYVEQGGAMYVRRSTIRSLHSSGGVTVVFHVFAGRVGDRRGASLAGAKTRRGP